MGPQTTHTLEAQYRARTRRGAAAGARRDAAAHGEPRAWAWARARARCRAGARQRDRAARGWLLGLWCGCTYHYICGRTAPEPVFLTLGLDLFKCILTLSRETALKSTRRSFTDGCVPEAGQRQSRYIIVRMSDRPRPLPAYMHCVVARFAAAVLTCVTAAAEQHAAVAQRQQRLWGGG